MARAHLYLPVATAAGDMMGGISVRLMVPGTTTLITDTIFSAASGTGTYSQPFTVANGVIDCYLDVARRVRVGVTPPGQGEFFLEDVDIFPDAELVLTSVAPMRVTNAPSGVGHVLSAVGTNTATWVAVLPGTLPVRETATYTTASLAANAHEQGSVTLANGYRLLQLQTSGPARVRLYTTVASRGADLDRAVGTDPAATAGVILDYVTTGSDTYPLSPLVDGANLEATPASGIPMTVTNLGTVTATVVVTLTWIRTE